MTLEIFDTIAVIVGVAGSGIIIWGAAITVFYFLKTEIAHLREGDTLKEREYTRFRFGSYLLLGLDFMLAADIIHTIHNPALNELYILALIVAIRSVISFFLTREMKESSGVGANGVIDKTKN